MLSIICCGSVGTQRNGATHYPLYTVSTLGPMACTLMAVPPVTPTVQRFERLAGESLLIRYNCKLPVMVYTPAEA
jgi:serine protease inhibitor ecotin